MEGKESRDIRQEMQGMPRKYCSYGSFCSCCRELFIEGLMLGLSKPVGDLSLAGVAARGESRVLNTRGGFM